MDENNEIPNPTIKMQYFEKLAKGLIQCVQVYKYPPSSLKLNVNGFTKAGGYYPCNDIEKKLDKVCRSLLEENDVNKDSFLRYAEERAGHYLSEGFDKYTFLQYCVDMVTVSAFFYNNGVDEVEDLVISCIMNSVGDLDISDGWKSSIMTIEMYGHLACLLKRILSNTENLDAESKGDKSDDSLRKKGKRYYRLGCSFRKIRKKPKENKFKSYSDRLQESLSTHPTEFEGKILSNNNSISETFGPEPLNVNQNCILSWNYEFIQEIIEMLLNDKKFLENLSIPHIESEKRPVDFEGEISINNSSTTPSPMQSVGKILNNNSTVPQTFGTEPLNVGQKSILPSSCEVKPKQKLFLTDKTNLENLSISHLESEQQSNAAEEYLKRAKYSPISSDTEN